MIKRLAGCLTVALMVLPFVPSPASAQDLVDSRIVERIECLFRVYVNEGGENGLDCLA